MDSEVSRMGWRKSSYSGGSGDCVEVSRLGRVHIRDSKEKSRPALAFSLPAWDCFVRSLSRNCDWV
ncbi:DUF397 domain-containing protein [Streptomyces sp. NPDC059215]|uniref:DUF397 domain-containing protein n=1 Tax=Streptomyces sp. NPDC059215 TaxID=3346772 RepID=UPI0036C2FB37